MKFYNIGKRIKYFREKAGLTQAQFGEAIRKSPHHITQIERGLSLPSLPMFFDIARVLNVPMDGFFIDDDKLSAEIALISEARRLDQFHHDDIVKAFEIIYSMGCSFTMPAHREDDAHPKKKDGEA